MQDKNPPNYPVLIESRNSAINELCKLKNEPVLQGNQLFMENIQNSFAALEKSFTEKIERMETMHEGLHKNLTEGLGELKTDNKKLQKNMKQMQTSIGEIQTSIGEIQTNIGEIQTSIGEIQTSIGEIQTSIGQIQTSIGQIQTNVEELKTSLDDIKEKFKNSSDIVGSNQAEQIRSSIRMVNSLQSGPDPIIHAFPDQDNHEMEMFPMHRSKFCALSSTQIKNFLQRYGLSTRGTKDQLLERLSVHLNAPLH